MVDRHKRLGGKVRVLTWRICSCRREALFLPFAPAKAIFFSAASAWPFASANAVSGLPPSSGPATHYSLSCQNSKHEVTCLSTLQMVGVNAQPPCRQCDVCQASLLHSSTYRLHVNVFEKLQQAQLMIYWL